ncbi:hypothetical protein B0H11DRAFT_2280520 [Mycena galericulata]|nr:hypothetical protein B0H11DRAFT_2280520 [Mycena galericulata]
MQKICLLVQDIIPATVSFCVSFGSVPESPIQAGPGFRESFACRNTWATNTECRSSRRGTSFLPAFIMSLSATFCSKQLSTSFDPFSEQSRVTLDWIIANGIPAPQSAASGILTVPSSGTVCSMPIKLSVCSGLPYDFVLGRDWSFFCCQTLPYASFSLSSDPSHLIDTSDSSATDITTQGCDKMRNPQTKFPHHHCRAVPLVGLTSFITYAILTLRVYALFNRKRVILWLLSLAGLGSLAAGVWLGSAADTAAPLPGSLCMLSHVSLIAAVDVANILSTSSAIKPFLAGSLAWLASVLSAVLTARLILNMREVADTNSMAVGDVASVEVSTVEWNDIDLLEVMVVSVGTGNER